MHCSCVQVYSMHSSQNVWENSYRRQWEESEIEHKLVHGGKENVKYLETS